MRARQLSLAVALVATLGASWWVTTREAGDAESPSVVQPVEKESRGGRTDGRHSPAASTISAGITGGRLDRLSASRSPWPDLQDDIARIVNFAPPPPPRPTATPTPVAPPLPYRFVGAIDDAKGKAVFLLEGSQVRMARTGEQLAGQYRVDRISPSGVEFTYLPLNTKQILSRQSP